MLRIQLCGERRTGARGGRRVTEPGDPSAAPSVTGPRPARAPIRVLSPTVAARIAAGEVIERPASVVKELVENALDAGARVVEVAIWGGGIDRILVRDDGCGIPATEIADAFERHATSKLRNEHELFAIQTLGFRGEALSAIAAAADVDFVTRPAEEPAAATARARGGRIERIGGAGAAPGTSVEVRDLFAALPARRRFLRAPAAEARAIAVVVESYALAYAGVAFRLSIDDRRVLTTDGSGELRAAFGAVHGEALASALISVEGERAAGVAASERDGGPDETASGRVDGLVSPPSVHRASRRLLSLFANGRAIVSRTLTHAVEEAYAGMLPVGRHPIGLLRITVPPDQIDVNVHPTKAEVRFRHERLVYAAVGAAVRDAITRAGMPDAPSPGSGWTTYPAPGPDGKAAAWAAGRAVIAGARASDLVASGAPGLSFARPSLEMWTPGQPMGGVGEAAAAQQPALPMRERLSALRALGQVESTYIVAEAADGLCLVDQHAAHERVLYEQVLQQRGTAARSDAEAGQVSQPLLAAVVVPLSAGQLALAAELEAELRALGFAIAPTDGAAVLLRAIPAAFAGRDPAGALADYLERLAAGDDRVPGPDRAAATLACRAAVMAGDRLDPEQQRALLRALEGCDSPHTCPHGRPTMLHLGSAALARSFGRK